MKNNNIKKIRVNNQWLEDSDYVRDHVVDFYRSLFKEDCFVRPKLDGLNFSRISSESQQGLERPFQADEVVAALQSLKVDKASCPNGFPANFYVEFWDVLGRDVMEDMEEFHKNAAWCRSLSVSFISLIPKNSLIPKKKGMTDIRDFRPISLVGNMYKLLAKVLSRRLKGVMEEVISELMHFRKRAANH